MAEHVHWKKLTNPDYLGSYAFDRGEEKIGTIRDVRTEMVTGADGKKEQCTVIYFAEPTLKPLIANKTNCKAISKLYGTAYIDEWVGKRIIMGVRTVSAFGEKVEAVRIKPEIPKAVEKPTVEHTCSDCKNPLKPYGKMGVTQLAQYTTQQYGRVLCADCAAKMKKAAEEKTGEPL